MNRIQSEIKTEINKAAHYLAQVNQAQIKYALDAKCDDLIKEGKSADDITKFLRGIALRGTNGLDELLERTEN
jgi:hypothetical protein